MTTREVAVNIVVADRGWILERLARAISERFDYVTVSDNAIKNCHLQYYLNYSSWTRRVSPVEVAYFTHVESDDGAQRKFFEVAKQVDYCVCHSEIYEKQLRDRGIDNVVTISPGIDLDLFKPIVKIGVVGRTYATGRKGEALVEAMLDIDGLEWHFTGHGWPRPARDVPPEAMPAFYNEMDYILVPSLYEGGPMAVAEAVACGTPVIAPPIGWVGAFPHREYKTGDPADLRRVLEEVVAERYTDRPPLALRSWAGWAEAHDQLFRRLLQERGFGETAPVAEACPGPVLLALHSGEAQSLGGPSVRVPATAAELREFGVPARAVTFPDGSIAKAALVHGFNVWSLESAVRLGRYVRSLDKPFVFSPIYLDQSEFQLWGQIVPDLARRARDQSEFGNLIAKAVGDFARKPKRGRAAQVAVGYDATARALVELADAVVFLSEKEREALARIGAVPRASMTVHNPVNAERFASASGDAFKSYVGTSDYILCVGRIEPRKNQLLLLHALHGVNIPVVLISGANDPDYALLVEELRSENVQVLGRIAHDSPLLPSAYAGARLLVQPSWAEGAPLVALEAAAAGTQLILSDRSGEREYFQDLATYCDPSDPAALRSTILDAYETPKASGDRRVLREMVREQFSYERHARKLIELYRQTAARFAPSRPGSAPGADTVLPGIVLDLTSSVYAGEAGGFGTPAKAIARALLGATGGNVELIAWNKVERRFVLLDESCLDHADLASYVEFAAKAGRFPSTSGPNRCCLTTGSIWMENSHYCDDLVQFCNNFGLPLATLFDHLGSLSPTPAGMTTLRQNLDLLLSVSTSILVPSRTAKADLHRFAAETGRTVAEISVVRLGDWFGTEGTAPDSVPPALGGLPLENGLVFSPAVGEMGDSERLLVRMWLRLAERLGAACPLLVIALPSSDPARLGQAPKVEYRASNRIVIITGLQSAEMSQLIKSALLVILAPSSDSAWLPAIAGSLARGRICIAPSNSATKEAGSGLADVLDPFDLPLWMARLEYYLRSATARRQREAEIRDAYMPISWPAIAEEIQAVLARTIHGSLPDVYTLGTRTQLSDRPNGLRKHSGWYPSESWGCWSSDRVSSFSIQLDAPPSGDLVLIAELRSLLEARCDNVCDVLVNGRSVGKWVPRGPGWLLFATVVPARYVEKSSAITVEIRGSQLTEAPARPDSDSENKRRVGVGIGSIALVDPQFSFEITDFAVNKSSTLSAILVGEDIDLTRDPRAITLLPDVATTGTDWGARHVNAQPKLLLNILGIGQCDLAITLRYRAVATAEQPFRAMLVARTGRILGTIEASDDTIQECVLHIPSSLREQPLLIDFLHAGKRSPRSVGVGLRDEEFGIGFFGLKVEPAASGELPEIPPEPYDLGRVIEFRQYLRRPDAVLASRFTDPRSWHDAESTGTWTQGSVGRLTLQLVTPFPARLFVRIDATCSLATTRPTTLIVRVDGEEVYSEARWESGRFTIRFEFDRGGLSENELLAVEICNDTILVPSIRGLGVDDRRLGVFVHSLVITGDAASLDKVDEDVPLALGDEPELAKPTTVPDPSVTQMVTANAFAAASSPGSEAQAGIMAATIAATVMAETSSTHRKPSAVSSSDAIESEDAKQAGAPSNGI